MTSPSNLDAVDRRFLARATAAPGVVILAAGENAAAWAALAQLMARNARVEVVAPGQNIADVTSERGIRQIFMLRHRGPKPSAMLATLTQMLVHARIDLLTIGDFDVRADLPALVELMAAHDYHLFGVEDDGAGIEPIDTLVDGWRFNQFLAVQDRVLDLLVFNTPRELDIAELLRTHRIPVRGLVHLGAHEGQELPAYRRIGAFPIALIEAHPEIHSRLAAIMADHVDVTTVHAAVSDREGPMTLHVVANDQCNSLLPIGTLGRLLPNIIERATIEVPGRTLDSLFAEWRASGAAIADANVLVSDIQGAELMALQGGRSILPQLDAVVLEVSFDDLYTGCAQVEEIDQFMSGAGFSRVATVSAWHPGWSDAFYRRDH
jgi:FkbM family methyltransferase